MKTTLGAQCGWVISLLVGVASAACDAGATSDRFNQTPPGEPPTEQPSEPTEEQPSEPEESGAAAFEVTSVTPLDGLPASDTLVGVAIDPSGTTRFVLTEEAGLYEMSEGSATLVFDSNHLPIMDFLPELPFTDVVALSNKRFALTAKNEGYLLDTQDHSLTRFFCYLPSPSPDDTVEQSISETLTAEGVAVYQITLAVTHNADLGLLFAHPLTVNSHDGFVYGAEVGAFSDLTGEPMRWSLVPSGKLATAGATGMIADSSGIVTLARGVDLYSYDGASVPSRLDSLDRYGVGEIAGLAAVPGTDHILVLDAQKRQLVELAPKI